MIQDLAEVNSSEVPTRGSVSMAAAGRPLLPGVCPSQGDRSHVTPLCEVLGESDSQRQREEGWEPGAGGWGWGVSVSWGAFPSGNRRKFWEWMVVTGVPQCGCTECHWTAHLKVVKMVNVMLLVFDDD